MAGTVKSTSWRDEAISLASSDLLVLRPGPCQSLAEWPRAGHVPNAAVADEVLGWLAYGL
eukprot:5557899-Prymnesium_polylepis.1